MEWRQWDRTTSFLQRRIVKAVALLLLARLFSMCHWLMTRYLLSVHQFQAETLLAVRNVVAVAVLFPTAFVVEGTRIRKLVETCR